MKGVIFLGGAICPHLKGYYSFLIARTTSRANPKSSVKFRDNLSWTVFAGCCPPCWKQDHPDVISADLLCVSGPLLRYPQRSFYPFLPPGHWPSPFHERIGGTLYHNNYFNLAVLSKLPLFANVQTRRLTRHPNSSYPHIFPCQATVPFYIPAYLSLLPP